MEKYTIEIYSLLCLLYSDNYLIVKINYRELESNNCHVCPKTLTLKKYFFSNKTFFIFQDLKLKLSSSVWKRTSLDLTKFQLNRQTTNRKNENNNCLNELNELKWDFMNLHFKQMLKVSAFYLKKQKSFIPKKISFSRC